TLYEEGELAQVGEPVASSEVEGESSGNAEEMSEVTEDDIKEETQVSQTESTEKDSVTEREISDDGRIRAVHSVRIDARDKNVDLTKIEGSGKNGKITIEDIDQYIENPKEEIDK